MARSLVQALAVAALVVAAPVAATAEERCAAPAAASSLPAPLQRLSAKLRAGEAVTILAIGSSSTLGIGADSPAGSYPARLAEELAHRFPGRDIRVLNRGIGGETMPGMRARLERELEAERPDLVIWQTGTNDIVRRGDLALFRRLLDGGLARIRRSGADAILMGPQWAPAVTEVPEHRRYIAAMREAARAAEAGFIDRYAAMLHWRDSGQIPGAALLTSDRLHLTSASYACVAELAARMIQQGTASAIAAR